ncbi:MAG: LptF/LptG family permease, partial [Flavobacteriales bacterium]
HFYDEHSPAGGKGDYPMMRGTFAEDEITLDLTGLGLKRTDEDLFKDHYKMLTLGQLQTGEDSLLKRMVERRAEQVLHLRNSLFILRDATRPATAMDHLPMSAFDTGLAPEARKDLYDVAMNMVRNNVGFIDRSLEELNGRKEQVSRYRIEWHRKPMLAAACILFFFIGAPLGAIIRKGGMGLPTVFAIVFFLTFHIISFSTEKLVIAGGVEAWPGMWISTLVLLPIGLLLTWKAASDSPLFDSDAYYRGWERFRSLFQRSHAGSSTVQ